MAMYYYASKISAIACGTRCKQTVLQKSRGQRDRDKYNSEAISLTSPTSHRLPVNAYADGGTDVDELLLVAATAGVNNAGAETIPLSLTMDDMRFRRRHSDQLDAYDIDMGFQTLEVSTGKSTKTTYNTTGTVDNANLLNDQPVQYDVPKNTHLRSYCDVNYESSVLGSGGIMYINGRIVSGPLESLIEILVPKNSIDFDKDFIFSFLLSSRLFLRPHELLGKLLSSVPESESSESLVALLAEWTNKFPYDYRDERMMNHVKHIVARCSNTHLEDVVSQILSALLKRLTDLERHEADLRACQTNAEMSEFNSLERATASQYAQILCRLEKKLAKHVGPEEFLQCSSNILLDKQKKWDQPAASGGPPGIQDPKKTCNLETYLDWSARLRLFVCNEILQCIGIHDRSKTVELWSGVAQYCLLVGNYNSATAILESLESPAIARLKITWSKLQVTCQQLDCMQRHAEGHGDLWHKQAIVLNENHQKTDSAVNVALRTSSAMTTDMTVSTTSSTCTTATPSQAVLTPATTTTPTIIESATRPATTMSNSISKVKSSTKETSVSPSSLCASTSTTSAVLSALGPASSSSSSVDFNRIEQANNSNDIEFEETVNSGTMLNGLNVDVDVGVGVGVNSKLNNNELQHHKQNIKTKTTTIATTTPTGVAIRTNSTFKSNDWVVIPVFADIVKLALTVREECLQRLPNGHINICAFDRLAAIVGAFTKHMHAVKSATEAPIGEYEIFCRHMQKTSKLNESELMMASFDCEEPNNAEKLMYDLN